MSMQFLELVMNYLELFIVILIFFIYADLGFISTCVHVLAIIEQVLRM